MLRRETTPEPFPEYHSDKLIVRLQPDLGGAAAAMLNAVRDHSAIAAMNAETRTAIAAVAPGLADLERGGLIRQVTPLMRHDTVTELTPMAAVARSFASGASVSARSASILSGATLVDLQPGVDAQEAARRLSDDLHVASVSRVPIRYAMATKRRVAKRGSQAGATILATPPAASTMWNLRKIEWARARAADGFREASAVNVAVLDTGVDRDHPDLRPRIASYVFEHPDNPTISAAKDIVGHGTHVAGTISAMINNTVGINGVCQCRLRIWKIFGDQTAFFGGAFQYFVDPVMYERALADCLDENIDVINLSIGGGGRPTSTEAQLFNALLANDTIIVAAMGNERQEGSPTSFPAAITDVIAVGATTLNDTVANFSNRGDHIALSAPGTAIWSTLPTYPGQTSFEAVLDASGNAREGKPHRRETDYDAWDGTSMATPHVAGAAALLVAKQGRVGPVAARRALQRSADRVAGMNGQASHPDYGAGRLNLRRLLR